jgi:hypothetical protein
MIIFNNANNFWLYLCSFFAYLLKEWERRGKRGRGEFIIDN